MRAYRLTTGRWHLDDGFTVLRIVLGVIFVIVGIKIAFPPDPEALAATFVNPANGWISPFFAEQITGTLGIPVSEFLWIQGLMEIGLGLMMIMPTGSHGSWGFSHRSFR